MTNILSENITQLSVNEVQSAMAETSTKLIDLRDSLDREHLGCIAGSSTHFENKKTENTKLVFLSGSGELALEKAKRASSLGYDVSVLAGGMQAWQQAELPLVQKDGDRFYSLKDVEAMQPHILKRENIACYQNGKVLVGNRKDYPFKKDFVTCSDVEEVSIAIETMVTQGVGPWVAATYAMAMQADQSKDKSSLLDDLIGAKDRLIRTRPTNTMIRYRLEDVYASALKAIDNKQDPAKAILDRITALLDEMYILYGRRGQYGAKLLDDGDGVLTMCFAETSFVLSLAMAKDSGKKLTAYVPETRPYLQGARLTAPSLQEVGIDVKLITDNMPAAIMSEGKIQKYMTAADLITMDGHVVNKVGTFQNAITAHAHNIPFYAFAWGCDRNKPDRKSIDIEYRDPAEIRDCRGMQTTIDSIDAIYPAFDITPPKYVSGVVTRHGVLSPYLLRNGFEE